MFLTGRSWRPWLDRLDVPEVGVGGPLRRCLGRRDGGDAEALPVSGREDVTDLPALDLGDERARVIALAVAELEPVDRGSPRGRRIARRDDADPAVWQCGRLRCVARIPVAVSPGLLNALAHLTFDLRHEPPLTACDSHCTRGGLQRHEGAGMPSLQYSRRGRDRSTRDAQGCARRLSR